MTKVNIHPTPALGTTAGEHANTLPLVMKPSFDGRLFSGVTPDACHTPDWLPINDWGYHTAWSGTRGESVLGHRLSYRLFVGPIPDGGLVLHRCGNAACVNPHHLYVGDALQNQKDRNFHAQFDARRVPQTKLTNSDVLNIRASTKRNVDLAREYGVQRSTISNIRHGRARSNVVGGAA